MKGFLCSRGHELYGEIWNDQPPLHTALLSGLFKLFGPSVLAGRLLAVAFSALLVWAFYQLVRQRAGHFAALVALALLISSPHFLQLSVSVMIELPAMALALASSWAFFGFTRQYWAEGLIGPVPETAGLSGRRRARRYVWLAASGILMGCALQTKLTAAILFPALICESIAATVNNRARSPETLSQSRAVAKRIGAVLSPLVIWSVAALISFALIASFHSGESLALFWKTHFGAELQAAVAERLGFRNELLWRDYDSLIPALAGIAFVVIARRWEFVFPVVLLATTFMVHQFHRPYWYYYQLHFSIPMAWLGGLAVRELFCIVWRAQWADFKKRPLTWGSTLVAWSSLVSLILVGMPERLQRGAASMISVEKARENPIVREMTSHRDVTKWVFADRVIYAFHAGLPVPPELAVIPSKRLWSGQFDERELLRILKEYSPEQIVLVSSQWNEAVSGLLDQEYFSPSNGVTGFYLHKRLQAGPGHL